MTALAERAPVVRDSRRHKLRAATASIHDKLEATLERAGAFESLAGYAHFLMSTWQARAAVEAALDRASAADAWPLYARRRIADLILVDRRDVSNGCVDLPSLPQIPAAEFAGTAALLGALYVLEGSALGARVLIGRAARLGLNADFGARHLHAQSANRNAWPDFVRTLDAAALDAVSEAVAVAAAQRAFAIFETAYAPLSSRTAD